MSHSEQLNHGRLSPPTNLSRSASAGAGLGHKRSCSLGGASLSSGSPVASYDRWSHAGGTTGTMLSTRSTSKLDGLYSPTGGVLGQNFLGTSPSGSRRGTKNSGWGLSVKSKSSKTPQPIQALAMFEAVGRGLRECITVAEDDISSLKSNIECLSVSSSQQLKAAERYLKRVEFQLSKLEELFDQYELQQKLRDGVRSMAYAYVLSPGKERNTALNNVRSGYKECSEVMCAIESDLEQMMGTLTLQMKGIQGFSRLCPGDVFEICIKHGPQKWKNKGRVMKNSEQSWDNDQTTFKVLLTDVLVIKAVEVKGLGKNSILGNKFCDTADLFSAHPQIMTVQLNSSGSLKLNLIVTWNPLHCASEDNHPSVIGSNSTRSSPRSTRTYGGHSPVSPCCNDSDILSHSSFSGIKSINSIQSPDRDSGNHELSSNSSNEAYSCRGSSVVDGPTSVSEHPLAHKLTLRIPNEQDSPKFVTNGTAVPVGEKDLSEQQQRSTSPASCISVETSSSLRGSGSQLDVITIPVTGAVSLQDTINSVVSCLEDIQGQYPELQGLETTILELDEFISNHSYKYRRQSLASNISLSVENALGYFDFLDSEDDSETYVSGKLSPDSVHLEKLVDSKMIDRKTDQGFASLTSQQSDDGRYSEAVSVGFVYYEQVELTLISHLSCCQKLIESLGSFGPLKCQELIALNKLKFQSSIIERLFNLVKQVKADKKGVSGTKEIKESEIQSLWERCTEGGRPLCVTADMLLWKLQEVVDGVLSSSQQSLSAEVVKLIVTRIMDDPQSFRSEAIVTVYQFQQYFSADKLIRDHILSVVEEVSTLRALDESSVEKLEVTVKQLSRESMPPATVINKLASLMISGGQSKEFIAYFLEDLSQNETWRNKISQTLVEQLESDDEDVRRAACNVLKYFQPYDYMEQLGYIAQTDAVNAVRQAARSTLLTLGDFGRQALEADYVSEPDYLSVTAL